MRRRVCAAIHAATGTVAVLGLLLTLVLTGCSSAGAERAKSLRLPLYGGVGSIDPALASTPSARFVTSLLYSTLVKLGPDLHVIPELAVSLPTISNDGRSYTFTVRQDARFADGRHCTARDVAFSFARALQPGTGSTIAGRYLGGIEGAAAIEQGVAGSLSGIRILDRLTLRIRLAQPDADFLQKLAFPAASVVEQRAHGAGLPAGTGPWRLAGRNRDGSLTLLPRPHYFGGKLHLKSLLLIPVSGDPRALDLYRRGELDAARVSPARYPSLSTRPDFSGSDGLDAYYAVPEGASLLPLAVAIDRARVVARVGPSLTSLDAIVPPAVPDYVSSPPSLGGEEGERLPALAVQVVPRSDPVAQALGRALSASAGQQGTDPLHVRLIHARYLLPDPGLWLRLVLPETHSRWFRSLLPAADRLSNDPVTRMDAYSRLETWALERGLIVPLATASVNYVIKPAVQNLEVTPAGLMPENGSWATVSVT